MNALPVKNPTPQKIIDDLVADIGILKVAFVTLASFLKRSRPPDRLTLSRREKQPGIDMLDDRLRADIGLPPRVDEKLTVDLLLMTRSRF